MRSAALANSARHHAAPLVVFVTALLPAPALVALHFRDGPPARVTGGFGEDSCVACQFGNEVNDPAGRLTLAGFPERYVPGVTYDLELTLMRKPTIAAAGFQLAVRQVHNRAQAGTIKASTEGEARIGGEEFALLLPGMTQAAAAELCERLRSAIEAHDWRMVHPHLRVTVCIGVAQRDGTVDGTALLEAADAQLYRAKRAGRNRVA